MIVPLRIATTVLIMLDSALSCVCAGDVGGPFHMQNTSFLVNAAQMETSR